VTDWGRGAYEVTADRLAPAARRAVELLGVQPGERVLDVACGTGNGGLEAARAGASAVGVDQAERLVSVARERATTEGLDARFEVGDATALPAADGEFDAAMSLFGVIFADARAAADELLRVTRPGGRIVLTTWTDTGATPQVMEVIRETLGGPERPPVWSDPDVVRPLFPPGTVSIEEDELAFTAPSVEAYVAEHENRHPMWLEMQPAVQATGRADELRERIVAIFTAANEAEDDAFLLPVPYRLVTVRVPER
jgi:SAM-dependent methyltransferase